MRNRARFDDGNRGGRAECDGRGFDGSSPVTGCRPSAGTHIAVTSSYRFALRVGLPEKIYTPAQARKMHPKSGEIMLRDKMSGGMSMGGIPMGGGMRHPEVQICSKKTRSVITNAHPTIVVTDDTAKGMPTNVPIAVMEGVGEGIADPHYGNNVRMTAGHRFTVTVKVKGQRAVFHVRSPKTDVDVTRRSRRPVAPTTANTGLTALLGGRRRGQNDPEA